jgi:RNA polymerase sigma factor (sigma-70 family)
VLRQPVRSSLKLVTSPVSDDRDRPTWSEEDFGALAEWLFPRDDDEAGADHSRTSLHLLIERWRDRARHQARASRIPPASVDQFADDAVDAAIIALAAGLARARRGQVDRDPDADEDDLPPSEGWATIVTRPPSERQRWAFGVCKMKILKTPTLKRWRERAAMVSLDAPNIPVLSSSPDPLGEMVRTKLRRVLAAAMMKLNDRDRTVVRLRVESELPYEDIAQQLELKAPAVRKIVERACLRLSESLRSERPAGKVRP